jgi:hypothetical protein
MKFAKLILGSAVLLALLTPHAIAATKVTLSGRVLKNTTFQVTTVALQVICSTANCSATAGLFGPLSVVCPGAAGATCTYDITVRTQTFITPGDEGFYKFLVDGIAPLPGPTVNSGQYPFDSLDNSPPFTTSSVATVAKVKNATSNQAHSVLVKVGCIGDSDGCFAQVGFGSVRIDVFQP